MRSFTKHQVTCDKEHSSVCFGAKRKYLQVAVEKFFLVTMWLLVTNVSMKHHSTMKRCIETHLQCYLFHCN
jgi:hypothetical protein